MTRVSDRQIQNPKKDQVDQQDQELSSANQGEVRQDPQRPRNESDTGIHLDDKKESDS
jgi:hypothetical protein